jgi:hypothetical protein
MNEQFQLCDLGALSSWKTASLFRNNIWIMGYIWLPNPSTYSLAVIWPWMVIMEPTEYRTVILLPKPSQSSPRVSLLKPSVPDYRLSRVFSKRKTPPDVGNSVKDDSSDHIKRAFPVAWGPGFMVVTPSFTHLIITFSNQRFSNCSPTATIDVGLVKLTSDRFCGNRVFKMNIQFCCSSSVIFSK